jgi:thiosulfate dehydrogenase
MRTLIGSLVTLAALALLALAVPRAGAQANQPAAPVAGAHAPDGQPAAPAAAPAAAPEELEVKLCDNHTTTTVPADQPKTAENGAKIAQSLMAQWLEKNPDSGWVKEELEKHELKMPADNSGLVGRGQGATYAAITAEDVLVWKNETVKLAAEGSTIFHSGDKLKSQIAVSCDMCHPHASNTHPETYPKYQVQLGRVALLRDMINWCIEHPVRGEKLEADSANMRALEAYILAQRKGAVMDYGKR